MATAKEIINSLTLELVNNTENIEKIEQFLNKKKMEFRSETYDKEIELAFLSAQRSYLLKELKRIVMRSGNDGNQGSNQADTCPEG